MEALTLAELDACADALDAALAADLAGAREPLYDFDPFCSTSDWIIPAANTLMPPAAPWIRRGRHGWLLCMRHTEPDSGRHVLQPLESMWGLAGPLVPAPGATLVALADEVAGAINHEAPGDYVALSGLMPHTERFLLTARALNRERVVRLGPTTRRRVASLAGGAEGFLSRRSARFRANLRRAARAAERAGVRFVRLTPSEAECAPLYARVLEIEDASWKGLGGVGFTHSQMVEFYRQMWPRLARHGALRVVFAVSPDGAIDRAGAPGPTTGTPVDLGFLFGGVFPVGAPTAVYRGLQFSYREGHDQLSLGNLLQWEMIRWLAEDGVLTYDLGTDVDYKHHWGERAVDSVLLIALPIR